MAHNFPPRGAGNEALNSDGGQVTVTVAAGAGTNSLSTVAGRLCRIMVTTAGTGTGSVQFFDDPGAAQGTVIAAIPATVSVGPQQVIDMPFVKGLTVVNVANGPALTVSVITA